MPLLGLAGVAVLKPGPASAELPPTPAPAVTKNDLAKTGVLAGISAGPGLMCWITQEDLLSDAVCLHAIDAPGIRCTDVKQGAGPRVK